VERRKLIRLRGSFLVYLPKKVAAGFASDVVSVFWEGDFVGVRPAALRRAASEVGHAAVVVGRDMPQASTSWSYRPHAMWLRPLRG
jgi:hypothetical protein